MKTHSSFHPVQSPRASQAFTLVEIQISMAILMLVIGGVISSHVFGLKLNEATRAKLSASDSARNSLNKMVNDVRSAKTIQVGSGNLNAFSPVTDGSPQRGSALRIYPTTNTNSFVPIAEYLTNTVLFTSESYNGTVLTDNQNNRVIGVDMQFYQIRYPITTIGAGGYFDYYQVKTKITRRALE